MSLISTLKKIILRPFRKRNDPFDEEDMDEELEEYDVVQEEPEEPKSHPFLRIPFRPSHVEEETDEEYPVQQESVARYAVQEDESSKGQMGVLQRMDNLSRPKKLLILGGLGLFTVSGMVIGVSILKTPKNTTTDTPKNELAANPPAQKAAAQPVGGTVMINPFVDDKELAQSQQAAAPGSQLPGAGVNRTYSGGNTSGGLPAIPNTPRPNVPTGYPMPTPQIPSNPNVSPATAPASQQSATVQGVVTGSDGNNMAIMSDGTVLSKGESYNDGRIAYIGGDGIRFENGSSMKFNN